MDIIFGTTKEEHPVQALEIGEWKWESKGRINPTDDQLRELGKRIETYLSSRPPLAPVEDKA